MDSTRPKNILNSSAKPFNNVFNNNQNTVFQSHFQDSEDGSEANGPAWPTLPVAIGSPASDLQDPPDRDFVPSISGFSVPWVPLGHSYRQMS